MAKWNVDASDLISKHLTKFADKALDAFESGVIDGASEIIESSPIGINVNGTETGVYRGNWQIGRQVNNRIFKTPNKSKGRNYAEGKIRGKLKKGGRLFLFNNSPYGSVIEFGGYPDPVEKGTYIRGQGYVKRSAGGYSKQAPGGHVRTGIKFMRIRIKQNLKKVKL